MTVNLYGLEVWESQIYVKFTNGKGYGQTAKLQDLMDYCASGRYGLTNEDAKAVRDYVNHHTREFRKK